MLEAGRRTVRAATTGRRRRGRWGAHLPEPGPDLPGRPHHRAYLPEPAHPAQSGRDRRGVDTTSPLERGKKCFCMILELFFYNVKFDSDLDQKCAFEKIYDFLLIVQ